jgi:pre-mRNA-processing factor 6
MAYPFPWGPPPPGYVPGLGRGAVGFVTRIENGIIDFETDSIVTSKKKLQRIRDEEQRADDFYRELEAKLKSRTRQKPSTP